MAKIEDAVWERARAIYERDPPRNEVWGDNAESGRQALDPQSRDHRAPSIMVVNEVRRAQCVALARRELEAERALLPRPD